RSAIARIPASTPGPMIVTSISAQISALIERDETMMNKASGRTAATLGVVLRAAQYARETASITASAVPSVAILMVSHIGRHSAAMKLQSGGTIRAARSAAWIGASRTNGQIVRSEIRRQL